MFSSDTICQASGGFEPRIDRGDLRDYPKRALSRLLKFWRANLIPHAYLSPSRHVYGATASRPAPTESIQQ